MPSDTKWVFDLDGLGVAVFWICITVLFVVFVGDPDLMDAIIHKLMLGGE